MFFIWRDKMLLLPIGGLAGLMIALYLRASAGAKIVFFVCGVTLGMLVSVFLGLLAPHSYALESTVQLVSMRESNASAGSFFLGSGNFGPRTYYSYYVKTRDGGYENKQLAADAVEKVTIYEETRPDGVLKIYRAQLADPSAKWWALYPLDGPPQLSYTFHIPEGSIRKVFALGE